MALWAEITPTHGLNYVGRNRSNTSAGIGDGPSFLASLLVSGPLDIPLLTSSASLIGPTRTIRDAVSALPGVTYKLHRGLGIATTAAGPERCVEEAEKAASEVPPRRRGVEAELAEGWARGGGGRLRGREAELACCEEGTGAQVGGGGSALALSVWPR
ncbi:hypothetical protein E2562_023712 [Oryza meyeriana var. granulata]|uniref:Uncharacterized protein n=1 Tax=Oryza meyeriana var. granulata TaxID=110450 RepID=A0A6G1DMI1_9ORYZ|nr:hypothetical protein E2562_023712 [Oryza meyeriana var. granulata]